jgi:hypothetical protein
MPWTWGNFLFSEGTKQENLKFLAKGPWNGVWNYSFTGYWNSEVYNDSTDGAYDNNNVYTWDPVAYEMKWTYLSAYNYGFLNANFRIQMNVDATATANSDAELRVHWFKNGVQFRDAQLVNLDAPPVGRSDFQGMVEDFASVDVNANDIISAKIYIHTFDSGSGRANIMFSVDAFELEYLRSVLTSTINFDNFLSFKKTKFLDYLRGVVDEFNLAIQTDPVTKVVYMEPTHPYALTNNLSAKSGGYFNEDFIDWNQKQDISKESTLDNYSDAERELIFRHKDDSNDGILKKIQDRNANKVALGKYVFPSRFKTGKKEIENRFFSPVMHYDVEQWKAITGTAPQMVVLVPENISNTSREEAQNTFSPKSCYYKGLVSGMGWKFDGDDQTSFPFMFAVNYKPGGENDPILSYSDEKIGTDPTYVVGKGLLRRFYLQRMAVMRNGQYYTTHFRLNNYDVMNFLHREHVACRGQRWELVEVNQYKPLKEESTSCFLRKWAPVNADDDANVFPSSVAVLDTPGSNAFDIKYSRLLCLPSDIPK